MSAFDPKRTLKPTNLKRVRQGLSSGLVVLGVLGSAAGFTQEAGPRRYLSDEYFQKQRECDTRPPYSRSQLGEFDYGNALHQAKRPAVWKSQRVFLGKTCFVANAGPIYYSDGREHAAAYYSLDVEAPIADATSREPSRRSWVVLFRRDLNISDLPDGFEKTEISKVVSYNESARTVHFKIGVHQYGYRLPPP